MDIKKNKAATDVQREGLEFIVMPEIVEADKRREERGKSPIEPPTQAVPPAVPPKGPEASAAAVPAPHGKRKFWIVVGAALGLLILGGLGYLTYEKYFNKIEGDKPLPDITVDDDKALPKDTDKDGLSDSREKELGTKAGDPDSDGDGLADGDEADVYGSDPLLPDTDGDKFDDGQEVAGSFSPTQNSSQKAGTDDLRKWQSGIEQYGLHEPTKTTLKLKAAPAAEAQETKEYINVSFFYSVRLPEVLAFRESADRTQVGIYITGSSDLDPDFNTDPIFINTSVLAGNQTLKEGVLALFPQGQYAKLTESKLGQWDAVTLEGVKGEACPQTKTFVRNKSTVIVLTQTCEDMAAFTPFYQDILQSFKFTK